MTFQSALKTFAVGTTMLLLVALGALLMPDRATAQPPNPILTALQSLQNQIEAQRPRTSISQQPITMG